MSERTDWDDWGGRVATHCAVSERPAHSQVLGPDGRRLKYEPTKVGFDLSRRASASRKNNHKRGKNHD